MKKNRPGTMVQVLCEPSKKAHIVRRLLSETSSLGVRFHEVYRTALEREAITIDSPFGRIAAKRIRGVAGEARVVPEYEVCKKIALEKGLPLQRVYDAIVKAASI